MTIEWSKSIYDVIGGEMMNFEALMARIETLWEELHESISDLPEEKQARILAIVEELESLTSQAEEEART